MSKSDDTAALVETVRRFLPKPKDGGPYSASAALDALAQRLAEAEALALRLDTNLNFAKLYDELEARAKRAEAALRALTPLSDEQALILRAALHPHRARSLLSMENSEWPFDFPEPPLDSSFPLGQVVFDLDGTLAHGVWPKRGVIGEPIWQGIKLLWYYANKGYSVVIHTSRGQQDYDLIWEWVKAHGLPVDKVRCDKPVGAVYFDDRAVRFPVGMDSDHGSRRSDER